MEYKGIQFINVLDEQERFAGLKVYLSNKTEQVNSHTFLSLYKE